MSRIYLISLIALLSLGAAPASAQESRGAMVGRVMDASGAVVPNASVRAVNLATNTGASSTTNGEGNYELPYLTPGSYNLEIVAGGFKKFVREVEIRVDDRLTIDATLEVGSTAEVLIITAETPMLEAANASLGQVIDSRRIAELPLPNGNPWALTQLAAGVSTLIAPGHYMLPGATDMPNNLSVDGTPKKSLEFTLDGAPNMSGDDVAFIPPADIVEEFKVQTTSYDASAGHTAAGSVNAVIKSGGNRVHGSLFEFNTSGPMRGTDFFTNKFIYDPNTGPITPQKIKEGHPAEVLNRYGGMLTGPVWLPKVYNGRNRTFFSYAFQGFARRTADHQFYNVPSDAQRGGDFSALLKVSAQYQIYDPATAKAGSGGRLSRQPFAGNIIPASRISPMAVAIAKYWPTANAPGSADGRQNYGGSVPMVNDYESHTGRLDHVFSDRHRMFGRITKSYLTNNSNRIFANIARGDHRIRENNSVAVDDVVVFGPEFMANFRFGATRNDVSNLHNSTGFDITSLGFPKSLAAQLDQRGATFPQIKVNGLTDIGEAGGDRDITNYYSAAANFTRTAGNHSVRFGGEYRILQENGITWGNVSPLLNFAANWTKGPLDNSTASPNGVGQGFASFLLGLPTAGSIDFNPFFAEQSSYAGLFVQDDWRITRKLTLNIGVRYEWETPLTERYNRSVRQFDFATPNPIEAAARANYARSPIPELSADRFSALGGLTFAGVGGNPRTLWRTPRSNFAPRAGLAYNLSQRVVIRAGYGVFYGQLGSDKRDINLDGFSLRNALNASLDSGLTFVASLQNPFPDGLKLPLGASGGLSTNVGQGVSFFYPEPATPYMQRWSFSTQVALPGRTLLEATYVGNRGTKLGVGRQFDPVPAQYLSRLPYRDQAAVDFLSTLVTNPFNPMLPGTGLAGKTIARSQLLRPYPQFTGISANVPAGSSWYHALQTRVEKRYSAGYTLQASYTWSKYMQAINYLNPTDQIPEHVISDNDRPHRLVVSGIYEFPLGVGRRWANSNAFAKQIVGGWQVQGIYSAQSGEPLGFGDIFFYGDLHDIPLPRNQRTPDLWFNTKAGFERDPAKQPGNHIQNMSTLFTGLRSDGQNMWNLSIMKHFPFSERLKLQFRAEAQNALNHAHFKAPITNVMNTLFGTVNGTVGNPRLMFIGLKLLW